MSSLANVSYPHARTEADRAVPDEKTPDVAFKPAGEVLITDVDLGARQEPRFGKGARTIDVQYLSLIK